MRRLILRPGAIGDCILALPALEHLAADYTEVWISSPLVPLIQFADVVRPLSSTGIDLVGVGDLDTPVALEENLRTFDSVVSWYGANRPAFRDALTRMGIACEFHAALPPAHFPHHATEYFSRQVGASKDAVPRLSAKPSPRRNSTVIHPFSGSKQKNWPLDLYEALAERIDSKVEWTIGPEEVLDRAQHFANLAELASWLSGARFYIGNDSGITHLAAAANVPTLALFGPTDPAKWAPRGKHVTVLRANPIEELNVETVLGAANRLLGLDGAADEAALFGEKTH